MQNIVNKQKYLLVNTCTMSSAYYKSHIQIRNRHFHIFLSSIFGDSTSIKSAYLHLIGAEILIRDLQVLNARFAVNVTHGFGNMWF